jgi:SAM-dependent methyltransferase
VSDSPVDRWEAAYLRFETPWAETRKFLKRLRRAGARDWSRDVRIVELFCGRGGGLRALERLGFSDLEGIDLSPRLVAECESRARIRVADCRSLPLEDATKDVVIVQGGLHHLPVLPGDLAGTLSEARRVLRPGGRIVIVEPWPTPFLSLVHRVCESRAARALSRKVDALATMIEHERATYEQWLSRPGMILGIIEDLFEAEKREIGWGKLLFVGRPR